MGAEETLFQRFGKEIPKGTTLFSEGEPGKEMFVLQSGQDHHLEEGARRREGAGGAGPGRVLRRDGDHLEQAAQRDRGGRRGREALGHRPQDLRDQRGPGEVRQLVDVAQAGDAERRGAVVGEVQQRQRDRQPEGGGEHERAVGDLGRLERPHHVEQHEDAQREDGGVGQVVPRRLEVGQLGVEQQAAVDEEHPRGQVAPDLARGALGQRPRAGQRNGPRDRPFARVRVHEGSRERAAR